MLISSWVIIIACFLIIVTIIIFQLKIQHLSGKSIYENSGSPRDMAKAVLSSIHITSQILFAIIIIGLLCVLMTEKVVEPNSVIPVIASMAGYILGKSFKDISATSEKEKTP